MDEECLAVKVRLTLHTPHFMWYCAISSRSVSMMLVLPMMQNTEFFNNYPQIHSESNKPVLNRNRLCSNVRSKIKKYSDKSLKIAQQKVQSTGKKMLK